MPGHLYVLHVGRWQQSPAKVTSLRFHVTHRIRLQTGSTTTGAVAKKIEMNLPGPSPSGDAKFMITCENVKNIDCTRYEGAVARAGGMLG